MPPSVLALPPRARTILAGFRLRANRMASPKPRLEAFSGSSFPSGQEPEAAGVGDLDDGGDAVERDACLDVLAGGPGDGVAAPGEAGGDGGVDAAVTSVRQRKQLAVDRSGPAGGIGGGAEPGCQGVRHFAGGEAAFELVGCDEGPHGFRGGGVVPCQTVSE